MNKTMNPKTTRREFLKHTSQLAAITALTGT
ncbi:MAG: twin-arginine translocation signal domain-containing protein, partial [Verrucomicrobia subdivision 3 bacterium]|nr:twin-arginine translocation signal domain-containing protein [Limisphaerales bacterium]